MRFTAPPHTPPPQTLTRPEGALERREAPSPPRTYCFIARTRCHRPEPCRRVSTDPVAEPEPALHSLRQVAAAPATTTEMATDSTPAPNPDGLHPLFPLCSFVSCIKCCRSRSRTCLSSCIKCSPV
jgi:hypothetical protein